MIKLAADQLAKIPEAFRRIVEIDRSQAGPLAFLSVARERRYWRRMCEIACSPSGGGRSAGAL